MADIKETDTHPSALSEAERERMNKLVEEDSGELEETDVGGEAAGVAEGKKADEPAGAEAKAGAEADAKGKEGKEAAEPAAGAAEVEGGTEGGDPAAGTEGAGKVETVSKKEFDGVLNELRDTRRLVQALRGPKLDPLPTRDFDAEDGALDQAEAALEAKYDEDPNFTDADYRAELREINKKRREIDKDRARYEVRSEQEKAAQAANEVLLKQQQDEWDSMVAEWQEGLGDWIKNPARRNNVNATMAAMMQDPEDSKLGNAEFIARLESYLADEYPSFPKREAGAPDKGKVDPRRQLAAGRAAEAGAAPPRMQGGTGNRATTGEQVDIKNMKLGDFGKLSKEKQDAALGLTDR